MKKRLSTEESSTSTTDSGSPDGSPGRIIDAATADRLSRIPSSVKRCATCGRVMRVRGPSSLAQVLREVGQLRKEFTVPELISAVGQPPKEVYNSIAYMTRREEFIRVSYGKYHVVGHQPSRAFLERKVKRESMSAVQTEDLAHQRKLRLERIRQNKARRIKCR